MGQSPHDGKAFFHRRAIVALTTRKTLAIVRDNIQLLAIGAALGRLGQDRTYTLLGNVGVNDEISRKIGKV